MQERRVEEAAETVRLYYTDSHMREFDAEVIACEAAEPKQGMNENVAWSIVLDRTAFYPEGGGQYGDTGKIGDATVYDAREKNGLVYHYTDKPIEAGTLVHGSLNWKERFSRMQQHSGEHIVSGIVHDMKGYNNVGFHIGPFITTLDFNGPLTPDEIRIIEYKANKKVAENIKYLILFPTKEEEKVMEYRSKIAISGQVRLIMVPGVDCCACCAPHVYSSGEIGIIKIVDAISYKGGTRISMICGMRALQDYSEKERLVKQISNQLSAPPSEIDRAVAKMKATSEERREKLIYWQKRYLSGLHAGSDGLNIIFEEDIDKNAAREFVNSAVAAGALIGGAFIGTDETGYSYILGSVKIDMKELSGKMNAALNGKGGGKKEMVQGAVLTDRASLFTFLHRYIK